MIPPTRQGRPSKLTTDTQRKIVLAISGGNFRHTAARWVGIHEDTFDRWMAQGKKDFLAYEAALDASDAAGEAPPDMPPSVFADFYRAVIQAEEDAEIAALAEIRKAGQRKDPKHLQWWLERKFPERWGRKFVQKEISGPGGKPIEVADASGLTDEERLARLRKLLGLGVTA